MEKLSELAKEHPGKAKFAVALLTQQLLLVRVQEVRQQVLYYELANELLAGEQLPTAVGKAAKTAAWCSNR